jgi:biopolymer transport protein ExbD
LRDENDSAPHRTEQERGRPRARRSSYLGARTKASALLLPPGKLHSMKLASPVPRRHSRIVIIPLIDIMFFLLASFMMVSLQMDKTHNIKVNLPYVADARHEFKPGMLNIAVDTSGAVWLQKTQITLPELSLVLSNRFQGDTNLPVFISGDRDTLHGAMVNVYEVVRNAGIQNVDFAVGGAQVQTNR